MPTLFCISKPFKVNFSEINRDRKNGISPSKTNAIPPGQDFDYVNELFDRIAAYIPFTDTHNVSEKLCSLQIV